MYLILAPSISCHILYADIISSLHNLRLVDPGSTLIHVGTYVLTCVKIKQASLWCIFG